MIFVCGIHGAGKTSYCKKLSKEMNIPYFTASDLITNREKQEFREKKVQDINKNQEILMEEILKIQQKTDHYILDGHLCLLNSESKIQKVQLDLFRKLRIESLVVIVDGEKEIKKRVLEKNGIDWDCKFIEHFQNEEIKYAEKIALQLKIDLRIAKVSDGVGNLFEKSIILPIKPIYAEKILNQIKKYEFRKKICADNIDKIYLYATAPVKGIVGEAVVVEKIVMNKDKMWALTKEKSGITSSYYDQYFQNSEKACAYMLGEVRRYDKLVPLKDVGICYVPQSYVYVENIKQ